MGDGMIDSSEQDTVPSSRTVPTKRNSRGIQFRGKLIPARSKRGEDSRVNSGGEFLGEQNS